jgi:mono/diheme cytochrome c family protein
LAKYLLKGLLTLIVIGIVGIFVLAWRPALDPINPVAAAQFPAELIAEGAVLAGAGNCLSCHTAANGKAYAGGVGLDSGFGKIFSTNITPDADTGIGRWSEVAFARAMHEGVMRDGSQMFPAFPYDHFTKVRDEDIHALYAFLMTRPAVISAPIPNQLPFPLNVRALQAGWKLLFFSKGVYQPDASKSAEWNRGAYLAEGLAHCASCHTPRNSFGAEKSAAAYAGAAIDGWFAPALSAASTSPMAWNSGELFAYLRSGATALHGTAAGPMSKVVHDSLAKLDDNDVHAIAIYFADINNSAARLASADQALAKAMSLAHRDVRDDSTNGDELYVAACASCHYNGGAIPLTVLPELALNSAISGPDPANLIHVILEGISKKDGMPVVFMPGFANTFDDTEIATLAAYLRRTRSNQPEWKDLSQTIAKIRQHGS